MRQGDRSSRAGLLGLAPGRALLAATLATDLFVAALIGLPLQRSLREQRAAAAASSVNLARLLEGGLADLFDKADLVLQAVADEHRRQLAARGAVDRGALGELLERQKQRLPEVLALRYLDAEGIVRLSAPAGGEGTSAADREFFPSLRNDPALELFIARPYLGRIARRLVLNVGRRLEAPDGTFAGVILAVVDVARLEELLGAVDVGAHGLASLLWQDLSPVARGGTAPAQGALGERRPSPGLQALLASGRRQASFEDASQHDGMLRTSSARVMGRYPLIVLVGLSPEDYLSGWRRLRALSAGVLAGFVLLSGAGTWAILRAWRRRLEHERLLEERTAELRDSEERFRTAFRTSPDAININRLADGIYVAVNEGFTRMSGWTEAEALGRSSLELEVWGDPADRARLVEGLVRDGFVENLEARFRGKDGREIVGLMSARRIQLQGEQVILSITRDVTRWRRAEEERDRLRERVQETQRLEGLGRLAGGVAHDFNNLLTVILGCCEVLREALETRAPEQLAEVEEVRAAGERARDLTGQLLAFARRQVVAPRALDLGEVLRSAERLLRRVLGEDVALAVEVGEGLWPVHCDPGQLEQVLVNLAVNARDAMPGGGTLTIAAHNQPPGWVRLAVRDTGTGMPPEVQAHLFEPFFTTKEKGKGTGLGLATVHGIVAQAGGRIEVQTTAGVGTTFAVLLPRSAAAPEAVVAPARPAASGGSETVLVIEDDPQVRSVTVRALQGAGYQLLVAGSGDEALALAEQDARRLDLVVSDVIMPGQTGPQVVEALRRRRPGLRALYVSGYPEDAMVGRGLGEQGTAFLPKPFTPASLLERVRALIDA